MFYTVNKMVTLGTAFGDIEDELEDMLDLVAEALDLIEKKRAKKPKRSSWIWKTNYSTFLTMKK